MVTEDSGVTRQQMKRYGNLYSKICDIDNIKLAHINASKGKKHYNEVKLIDSNIDLYCNKVKDMLENYTYKVSEYQVRDKLDKGKLRTLYVLPYFPDRIIQHAIMQVVEPIWKKVLIKDTFQSIKGRGIHKAKARIEEAIFYNNPEYSLKMDIKQFYPSITNSVLKMVVRRKLKCKGTLWLIDLIICSLPELPIGNYISQYLGNLTLAYIDHKIKEEYQSKMYYRYCDDIVVLGSKEHLHTILGVIKYELGLIALELKGMYQISPINDRGVDFVGFIFKPNSTRLRKSIGKSLCRATTKEAISSYFGWAKACQAKGLWYKHININKEFKW